MKPENQLLIYLFEYMKAITKNNKDFWEDRINEIKHKNL